ncbi:hypothetical protein B0I35DRAFT_351742 [Stachybotrys elegans]|uniref:DUF1479 domain protein n=1 Tax=Stachybotrys elegans TaxID=80388 RepID=A0A8K0WSA8_9HYPO|nr:hypothetical protein B0I35DRAFT_351742 [Stachybotrys elegans]
MPSLASNQLPLPARFARIKTDLIAGNEAAIIASWTRLLVQLRLEIETITTKGSEVIPSIDFNDISNPSKANEFVDRLRRSGVAVVRKVVPQDVVLAWRDETLSYLGDNPVAETHLTQDSHLHGVYWSPAQVKCRAHANVLAAQRFLMTTWHSRNPNALLSTSLPVAYADRLRIRGPGPSEGVGKIYVDGGSVERWEPDGYGQGSTYGSIWAGAWEQYDPWESSTRLKITSDLYYGASTCSMFRMFSGWLSLSPLTPGDGTLLVCPMIQLTTAYLLLRPFFSPIIQDPSHPSFLSSENWRLETSTSILHGAVPSYTQELSTTLHPHLRLDKTMVPIPKLEPGDYVVWHCDAVYAVDRTVPHYNVDAAAMYLPACPLTQTNALYLARQRKAFLLGLPSPDFGGGRGESSHLSRPGVQEVNDAGGNDGLRAMGLLPWDVEDAETEVDADVIDMANSILFPDLYD